MKLEKLKESRANSISKFKNSPNTKSVENLRDKLRVIPGPRTLHEKLEKVFTKLNLSWTFVKGGSFESSDCYKILKHAKSIAEVLLKQRKLSGIQLGSEAVLGLFLEWVKLLRAEFSLKCKIRSLCVHARRVWRTYIELQCVSSPHFLLRKYLT